MRSCLNNACAWHKISLGVIVAPQSLSASSQAPLLGQELAESGAGDEVIMSIAGHVSRAMLSRYSHVRMQAKRHAFDEIDSRQRAAHEKRKEEAVRDQGASPLQAVVAQ
jgi:hypothetical protein